MIIRVPAQTVRIMGKLRQTVEGFAVTSRPITAAEFALFARRTGYVTIAERRREEYSVYANPSLDGVPFTERSLVPALFLGRDDVAAYCSHNRVTLPSPCQWVAFLQHVSRSRLFTFDGKKKCGVPQLRSHFSCCEWIKSDRLLGRPPMVQLPGVPSTEEPSEMLVEHNNSSGDISITFRVVIEEL
jgi:hypothetical protein